MLNWFKLYKANQKLEEQVTVLESINSIQEEEIDSLNKRLRDPSEFISSILQRGIEWYDHSKLDQAGLANYYADAQRILAGDVFNNELNHYIADLIKFNANESRDFNAVMNIRASIVALETFRNRLGSIRNPEANDEPVDPFQPI